MTLEVTDNDFEKEVLERSENQPVVVDLWAPWCGPCKSLGPILEKVIEETKGAVQLVKVNIDDNPGVAGAFRVQSIPAVFAIHKKDVVSSFVGAQGEDAVRDFVQKLLAKEEPTELEKLIENGDEESLRKALEIEADNESHAAEIVMEMVRAGNLLSDDDVVDSTIPVSDESLSAGYTEIEVGVDENG